MIGWLLQLDNVHLETGNEFMNTLPMVVKILRILVRLSTFLLNSESAITLKTMDRIHLNKYGRAEIKLFYKFAIHQHNGKQFIQTKIINVSYFMLI